MYTINCGGKIISCRDPLVMGILNATPDSFYRGQLPQGREERIALAERMILEGADIIDIGGQSTRPGSERIPADEELRRVIPLIESLHLRNPGCTISIDTYSSRVAREAVAAGATMVNDISGGDMDGDMPGTVAELRVPFVCMHMQGSPQTMQEQPQYDDVVKTVLDFFISRIESCSRAGIKDIIIDPGFGFGKTIEHNFRLLRHLNVLTVTGRPVLAGLSRKRTIYKTLGVTAEEAGNGTTVLNTMALMNGASLLRVHDVKEAREAVLLYMAYKKNAP